jgi:ACS family tartrate transporter-like MFS transporter
VAGQVLTGLFLATSLLPGLSWGWVFAFLCLVGFFAYFLPSPFWVLPTLTLSASAAAVSIGFINMCANLAGLLGSPVVGQMKASGFGDRACLLLLAGCYLLGASLIALIGVPPTTAGNPPEKACGLKNILSQDLSATDRPRPL